jgi:site-specific recombinase XerD
LRPARKENNLVFCASLGGPMYATDVRVEFEKITEKAGVGRDWTPRELRHTVASLLPDSGVPVEQIADALGHSSTRTTQVVCRHQLRPVTRTAAIRLGPLFESTGKSGREKSNGGQS